MELSIYKNLNLNIKSTLAELNLFETNFSVYTKMNEIKHYLHNNLNIPGILIIKENNIVTLLSRTFFFEHYSKPYSAELYANRDIQFFLDNLENHKNPLIISSSEEIMESMKIKLNTANHNLDDPIVVKFESGEFKILDSYELSLAHSYISSLAVNALKDANELKSDMLSIAAHDLKNPLNIIIGYTNVLEKVLNEKNEDILEIIHNIKDSSQHMLNLIIELLNSTIIESGKMELKKNTVDLSELISAIVYQNKSLAERKGQLIDFKSNWEEDFLVNGDIVKLREAFENLINNAIKYSPQNSSIFVNISKNEFKKIIFKVKDSGPGLSDEDMKKIFGKFQRLSAQPTGGENSTGLGLYITQQIIDLHQGKIWVESQLGKGAVFNIELDSIIV